ncbi:MAG: uroporphyrinogen-III synthase, partial [Gammaproteobacteria bacterium]
SALRRWLAQAARAPALTVIFQTGVGAAALFDAFERLALVDDFRTVLNRAIVVVRGPKPTAALRSREIRIDVETASPFTTVELLSALDHLDLREQAVTVQRHGGANPVLIAGLRARGAAVTELSAYRWSLPQDTAPLLRLLDALHLGTVDVLVVTSASQIENLLSFADDQSRRGECIAELGNVKILSIGPTCSQTLRDAGLFVSGEASPPKLGALMELIAASL